MNQAEHEENRALTLEDLAVNVEDHAFRALREAYRLGYIDGYIQRSVDEVEDV